MVSTDLFDYSGVQTDVALLLRVLFAIPITLGSMSFHVYRLLVSAIKGRPIFCSGAQTEVSLLLRGADLRFRLSSGAARLFLWLSVGLLCE